MNINTVFIKQVTLIAYYFKDYSPYTQSTKLLTNYSIQLKVTTYSYIYFC